LLVAQDLARYYGSVVGLNDLTLTVAGGVVGLLGPNGAGKSTLLKLIAGEIKPSRGTIRVMGLDPFANREYYSELGFCPQQDALYGEMSGLEFVTFLVRLSGFSAREASEMAEIALERVNLTASMHRRTREYSKGMRQRVKLAQAIAHTPRFLVVDEPMTGLDPVARREMIDLFLALAEEGIHILISSHVLHEIELLTSDVILLHRGRLLAQGPVPEIRKLLSRHPRKIELRARDARRIARRLIDLPEVLALRLSPDGTGLSLETGDIEKLFAELPRLAAETRAGIQSLEATDAGLEAVFDYLVT
jgi:ABC-2 type transport system ATP-binding protein